ncbi:MAG TPA: hypothetical protein PKL22_11465, partial [Saprospiraceae bacterium]|nr:hypothetical protein [Saprospiraceae bacterium]
MRVKLILSSIVIASIALVFCLFILSLKEMPKPTEIIEPVKKSGAWESMQFINTSRAYPEQDIPPGAYTSAYNYYKSRFENTESISGSATSPWYSLGPDNVGGRTLSMAFHPNDTSTIWLGSASGGLWKSTTGGIGFNAWTYVPTGYPVLGISSIAIDPSNPDIMYIGTGEMHSYGSAKNGLIERPTRGSVGIGILKSLDGGNTWNPSLDWQYQQVRGIWDLQINPLNPQVIYAATTEGVYKTNDGGTNWFRVLNELMVMDILLDPVDTNFIYAGVGNVDSPNPGIYRSANSGNSWVRVTTGLPPPTNTGRITLAFNNQNRSSIIALIADLFSTVGIYRSTNRGLTWTTASGLTEIVSYQGWYAKGLCMKDDDSSRVMFGGVYLFRSEMNGNFPDLLPNTYDVHPDIHDIVSNPLDPNKIYILTDGGLFRSDDFGDNYYDCTTGYVTSQSYIGSVSHQNANIMLAGLQDNNTIRYNGSTFWDFVIGGDGSFNAIDPFNDQLMYGSYQYLNILKSDDQGFSFYNILNHSASSFGGNSVAFIAPFALSYSNPDVLYAAGDSLQKSVDQGFSWTYAHNGQMAGGNVALCMAISWTNSDSIYIGMAPGSGGPMSILRSADGGVTFTNVSSGLPNRFPRDIAIDPRDSRIVYAAFSGFGAGHIYKSTDAGANWTDISTSLPDIPFHCITQDLNHPDTIYAGSDLGVFVSVDAGLNWDAMNLGLPSGVMIFDLVYSPADQSLVAFTHGSGVYRNDGITLPVGIKNLETNKNNRLELVRNPVRETLSYKFLAEGEFSILIYDITGKLIQKSS